jgi:hypothetical protein
MEEEVEKGLASRRGISPVLSKEEAVVMIMRCVEVDAL